MKKSIFFTALFAFLAQEAAAQLSGGFKAGSNLHRFNDEASEAFIGASKVEFVLDAQVSAVIEVGLTEKFALRVEPGLTQKGANILFKRPLDAIYSKSEERYTLNYVEMPILGKFSFSGNESSTYLLAGPSFGMLSSGKTKSIYGFGILRDEFDEDIEFGDEDGINRLEVAVAVGLGYQIKLGGGKLFADARFQQGLTAFMEEGGDVEYPIRNQGILLNFGYLFSF
jgi:hypothetical protein